MNAPQYYKPEPCNQPSGIMIRQFIEANDMKSLGEYLKRCNGTQRHVEFALEATGRSSYAQEYYDAALGMS